VAEVNKLQANAINEEEIVSIGIVGKEKKHLKVKTTSTAEKIKVITLIKKPENFSVSEYLTKPRYLIYLA
jgi:hypothetical protein